MTTVASNIDLRNLPPRASVGYLDPEIDGEGTKVILSDGEQLSWNPPPPKPVVPDWSQIKSIRHYFGRTGHQVWPAWFYHPKEEPQLMRNAEEARSKLGIFYREATVDEKGRYGVKAVWDWDDGCEWRAAPWGKPKFDPTNPGLGKTYIPGAPNPQHAQSALLAELIPAVAAAVAQSLHSTGPAKPATIDAADWDAFLQFKAFQKAQEAAAQMSAAEDTGDDVENAQHDANALALTPEQDREVWLAAAARKGIEVDGRWSTKRLKAEVEKAE